MFDYCVFCILPKERSLVIDHFTKEIRHQRHIINENNDNTLGICNGQYCKLLVRSDNCKDIIKNELFLHLYSCQHIEVVKHNEINNEENFLTYDELGISFDFHYNKRLLFLHETELRKVVLFSEIIEDDNDNKNINYYRSLLDIGGIHPFILIQFVDIDVGYGIFAKYTIRQSDFIGEYVGLVSSNNCSDKEDTKADAYSFQYPSADGGMKIDAYEYGNIIRFINHSNKPNCEFKRFYHCGIFHIICIALTDIPCDQQLTVNYGSSYWNNRKIKASEI